MSHHLGIDKNTTKELLEIEEGPVMDMDFVEAYANKSLHISPKFEERIEKVERGLGKDFYPKLIWTITQKTYGPLEAERLWQNILKHKRDLNSALGRDVGISVATLDYMSNILEDMPKAKVLEAGDVERMSETALTDGLTGVYMRSVFDVLLAKYVSEWRRYEHTVSLIMADIDDFKKINDRYGHQKGDEILRRIGEIFNSCVRDTDIVARYGGEEFAIILPETGIESAYELAKRMRTLVWYESRKNLSVSISLGVANCPEHAKSADSLMKAADEDLYLAKGRGKNRATVAETY
jgi:diguanylate cyclase (GGDEF)-like protein